MILKWFYWTSSKHFQSSYYYFANFLSFFCSASRAIDRAVNYKSSPVGYESVEDEWPGNSGLSLVDFGLAFAVAHANRRYLRVIFLIFLL